MRELKTIFLILVVMSCIFPAGYALSSGNSPVPPVIPVSGVSGPAPAITVPPAGPAITPQKVVTIIRYVSLPQDLKDSQLLFTLQVPAEWNVSTWQLTNSDTSDYRTDLVTGNMFSIYSYPSTRSREQEYRDQFRQWSPAPVETMVTINDIRYDRFEGRADGNTTVAYLARTNSANERGYASVLVFVAHDSNRFQREDFEKVVSSFRYFGLKSAGTQPGEEIPHYDVSGKSVSGKTGSRIPSVFDSSDWDSVGGSSSPAGISSSDSSTHSGGCHH